MAEAQRGQGRRVSTENRMEISITTVEARGKELAFDSEPRWGPLYTCVAVPTNHRIVHDTPTT